MDHNNQYKKNIVASEHQKEYNYWKEILNIRKVTSLPPDFQNPEFISNKYFSFDIDEKASLDLISISNKSDLRLSMVLITIVNILFQKYQGNNNLLTLTPVIKAKDKSKLINTIFPIKVDFNPQLSFKEALMQVMNYMNYSSDYLNYPLDILVPKIESALTLEKHEKLFNVGIALNEINDIEYLPPLNILFLFTKENSKISCKIKYNESLFTEDKIKRIGEHINKIINCITTNYEIKLRDIQYLSEKEKSLIIKNFDKSSVAYPQISINEILSESFKSNAARVALVFNDQHLTYGELDRMSKNVAFALKQMGVGRNTIVGIYENRTLDYIISIIGILKAGGIYLPIDTEYPAERVKYIIYDSNVKHLLLNKSTYNQTISLLAEHQNDVNLICIEDLFEKAFDKNLPGEKNSPSDGAYIIYTSGTTGRPKGSIITHENLIRLLINETPLFHFNPSDVWTIFHSFCFDFSVWELFGSLFFGAKAILLSKKEARDPEVFRDILIKQNVSILNQTPSAFYNLINEESKYSSHSLRIRNVIFGGEALQPNKLKLWQKTYPNTLMINMYGITETTVHVTYKEITFDEISSGISNIGKPIPTTVTLVVNNNLELLPPGLPGEICVGGKGVCRGYLNKLDLTDEKFIALKEFSGYVFYRSGDCGEILENGEIKYIDRIDRQFQLRGYRIELKEIESQLIKHNLIKNAIVIPYEQNEEKFLCAYYISDEQLSNKELRTFLMDFLPDYMIPSYFIQIKEIPLTINGKIDNKALPLPEISSSGNEFMEPVNNAEKELVTIWQEVLKVDKISTADSFFNLGGDSIKAIRLISAINKRFGSELKLSDLYTNENIINTAKCLNSNNYRNNEVKETICENLKELKSAINNKYNNPDIVDIYPLSDIQRGMFYYSLMAPDESYYHDQSVHKLHLTDFNQDIFREAIALIVKKHEILRTSFCLDEFETEVQIVFKDCEREYLNYDLTLMKPEEQTEFVNKIIKEDRNSKFDIKKAGLWRLYSFVLDRNSVIILFVSHHAILDGWSDASFKTELINIYNDLLQCKNVILKPLLCSYKEYVVEELVNKSDKMLSAFWENEMKGFKKLEIPHKKTKSNRSVILNYAIDKKQIDNIAKISANLSIDAKTIYFAIYAYIINLLSIDSDLVVGVVMNNRPVKEDGDKILGCFLNTLPVRLKFEQNCNLLTYFSLVDRKLREIKKHDKTTFIEVSRLAGEDLSFNPIFDTIFNFVNFHVYEEIEEDQIYLSNNSNDLDFDSQIKTNTILNFTIDNTLNSTQLLITYLEPALEKWFVENLAQYFFNFLNILEEADNVVLSKNLIINNIKKTGVSNYLRANQNKYNTDETLSFIIERNSFEFPDLIAIKHNDIQLSYRELNRLADIVSGNLLKMHIKPHEIIAIACEKTIDYLVTILGIMKIKAVFLPIDTTNPINRINNILKDTGADKIIVSENNKNEYSATRVLFKELFKPNRVNINSVIENRAIDDPVYIMYTSGSTGTPKGIIISGKNVLRVVKNTNYLKISQSDKVPQISNLSFDGCIFDIFISLCNGATLVIFERDEILSMHQFADKLKRENITSMFLTTALFNSVVDLGNTEFTSIKKILFGGERVSLPHVKKGLTGLKANLIHVYGPTESTVYSTYFNIQEIDPGETTIPIGTPISNTFCCILDNNNELLPQGVVGELCIGGEGLSEGYINNPELTHEKYLQTQIDQKIKVYKSGDLAKINKHGQIEFEGRKDNQIKLRGFRIELNEIEETLRKIPQIKNAHVRCEKFMGETLICAYLVAESQNDNEIKKFLEEYLPTYMIPSNYFYLNEFPLNSNDKIDPNKLPKPDFKKSTSNQIDTAKEPDNTVLKTWSEVLKIDKDQISMYSDFFALGGHSLKIMELILKIQKSLNVRLSIEEFFGNSQFAQQLSLIINKKKESFENIGLAIKKEFYQISSAQKRIYLSHEINPNTVTFNIPSAIIFEGDLNIEEVNLIFKKLISRHEAFRTSFIQRENEIYQIINEDVDFTLDYEIAEKNSNIRDVFKKFVRPFDLSKAPLLRVKIFKQSEKTFYIFIDVHHIVSDGVSFSLIMKEFSAFYNKCELQPITYQYKDYAEWHNRFIKSGNFEDQRRYWLNVFKDNNLPKLNLKTNFKRPDNLSNEGDQLKFEISSSLFTEIKKISNESQTTNFVLLLTAYFILLHKLTEQEDIIIGIPVTGRNHQNTQEIVGMFVNMLAIRNKPLPSKKFLDFYTEVNQSFIKAMENQDFQFEMLVDNLKIKREMNRHLVFDTVFAYNKIDQENEFHNSKFKLLDLDYLSVKFDIKLNITEVGNKLYCNFDFKKSLFIRDTISEYANCYLSILNQVIDNLQLKLKDIQLSNIAQKAENRNMKNVDFNF